MSDARAWSDAVAVDQLPPDDVAAVVVEGRELAFFRVGVEVWATDNLCTHGEGRLCDGFLEGHEIECPLHQGKFDMRSGKATYDPATEDIRAYPVKIEGGRVYVALG